MNNKQTTAMQELIDYLNANQLLKLNQVTARQLDDKCTELLTKEQEQHYNTFVAGSKRGTKDIPFNAEQYFDQTYKQP